MYDIVTATDRRGWRQFLELPRKLYTPRSRAIPLPEFETRRLLDRERNPALHGRSMHLLVVRQEGEAVGRCSVVLPARAGDPALFGFFECLDDQAAADMLLRHAGDLCRQHGVEMLHGPFSPTTSGVTGVQLDRYDVPNILNEACSLPYYARLLEHAGFTVERRGRSWRSTTLHGDMESLANRLPDRSSRFRVELIGPARLRAGIHDLAAVFDMAFRDSWARETMTLDEYFYVARYLLPAWRPDTFAIVYDGTTPVGAVLCLPDINPFVRGAGCGIGALRPLGLRWHARRSRTLIAFAIGILPEYRNSAAAVLLARHIARIARHHDVMQSTWITEGNHASERMAERFGLTPFKNFAVYVKHINVS
jgi:hypothetical protein